jgi:hypothetical protein
VINAFEDQMVAGPGVEADDPGVEPAANIEDPGVEMELLDEPGVDVESDEQSEENASIRSEEEDNGEEDNGTDAVDDRTHTITRFGRNVKTRKDIYENHVFTQFFSPSFQTPSVRETFGIQTQGTRIEYPANDSILHYAFTQYSLKQGLWKFPVEAKEATMSEMKQLHDMNVFKPEQKSSLTRQEILKTLGSIILIKEKWCGRIKARAYADGRPQRLLYEKHEASLPTVRTESGILASVIDAAEEREVAVYDILGVNLHAELPDAVHLKVTGGLARLLIQVCPDVYAQYMVIENQKEVIYLLLTRALYGCLLSALQFWKHLSANLQSHGYVLNAYDPYVANKEIEGL